MTDTTTYDKAKAAYISALDAEYTAGEAYDEAEAAFKRAKAVHDMAKARLHAAGESYDEAKDTADCRVR